MLCCHIGLLFGKRLDTILLRHQIRKYPDSPSTRYWIRCGFICFHSENGFKNIRIRCRIRRMRVDGKKKLRIQKYSDTCGRGLRRIYASIRQCASKSLKKAKNMCCWRQQQYRMRRIENSSSLNTSISMKLDQKREKEQRSGLICEKVQPGSHRGFFRFGFAAILKTQRFP